MNLESFETLVRGRRATRHFQAVPLPHELLDRLLNCARWAPSGYNLQPTHFVVVSDSRLKDKLRSACMGQAQVAEAPVTVIFVGDRKVAEDHLDEALALDTQAGAIDEVYADRVRSFVSLAFGQGPAGIGWLWKAALAPMLTWIRPIPSIPAVHKRMWLTKQAMLPAMTFMLAAKAAGLATCPMEGFDERRVRKMLGLSRRYVVALVVPVGYAVKENANKTRLPLERLVRKH